MDCFGAVIFVGFLVTLFSRGVETLVGQFLLIGKGDPHPTIFFLDLLESGFCETCFFKILILKGRNRKIFTIKKLRFCVSRWSTKKHWNYELGQLQLELQQIS
jgi:hypothetical protein